MFQADDRARAFDREPRARARADVLRAPSPAAARVRKHLKQAVCAACAHRMPATARLCAPPPSRSAPPSAAPTRLPAPKNICDKVLTVEKTVIRFRPNKGCRHKEWVLSSRQRTALQSAPPGWIQRWARAPSPPKKRSTCPDTGPHRLATRAFSCVPAPSADGRTQDRIGRRSPAQRIRPGAPCALAVARGSDTRGGFHWARST